MVSWFKIISIKFTSFIIKVKKKKKKKREKKKKKKKKKKKRFISVY